MNVTIRQLRRVFALGMTSAVLTAHAAPPNISTPPASHTEMVGATVVFTVVAGGTPPLSYQWRRNGNDLPGATGTSLTLTNIMPPNVGNYTVVVTNASGSVTSTPPAVLMIRDTFGYAVSETFFSFDDISSTGTRVLTNADDESAFIPFGFNFIYYGRGYSNMFVNPNGLMSLGGDETSSGNINLTNAAPAGNAPIIAVLWDDWQTLTNRTPHGDGVYYITTGAPGSRRFVVQWNNVFGYVSGAEGSPSGVTFQAILLENSRQIVLQYLDVLTDDSRTNGNLATIGLRDTDGQVNGKNLQWSFNQPAIQNGQAVLFTFLTTDPLIATHPLSRTNVSGTTATFTVGASGSTTPTYQWQSNGVNLVNGGNISGVTTPTLTITNVALSNAANYSVLISNTVGKVVSATAVLTVATPPEIIVQPVSLTNLVGTTVMFNVTATGFPLYYQWRREGTNLLNGGNVSGVTTPTLTLDGIAMGDAATYSVRITNVANSVISSNAVLSVFAAIPLATALDTAGLVWSTGGQATWYGQPFVAHDGVDAAQHNDILDDEESWMETTVTGPGTVSFWWKVSSEADFDLLEFRIGNNPEAITTRSGEVDWELKSVAVPAGSQALRWRYVKDSSQSAGQDTAWVDQVSFVEGAPDPQPFYLAAVSRLPDSTVQFNLNGEAGRSYTIEYSSNLANWYPLTNFTATNAVTPVLDPTVGPAHRFYRGVTVTP